MSPSASSEAATSRDRGAIQPRRLTGLIRSATAHTSEPDGQPFDLNIERVLEHWTVAHAVREIIANALDEHELTGSPVPEIRKIDSAWRVTDFGRGLRREHLTQNENREKLRSDRVIGKFGVGLKDALATFDRHGIHVQMKSGHGDITIGRAAKHGFDDIVTLHAFIASPPNLDMAGTEVVLTGVADGDVEAAMGFFLRYSGETVLEETRDGQVLARAPTGKARIYVRGLFVAEEENFLFSYNVTNVTTPLRKALNRERTNVGRGAYSDRVKAILLASTSSEVASPLAEDLALIEQGRAHDELTTWTGVAVHACQVLNSNDRVLFITASQLAAGSSLISHAREDGCRLVVVPETVAAKLRGLVDHTGQPVRDLGTYRSEWNDSFTFDFVALEQLTDAEREVYERTDAILALAVPRHGTKVREVFISRTMRLDRGDRECVGLWVAEDRRIIVRRDQLRDFERYAATLLHELAHAFSGADDESRAFEDQLTKFLGKLAGSAVEA